MSSLGVCLRELRPLGQKFVSFNSIWWLQRPTPGQYREKNLLAIEKSAPSLAVTRNAMLWQTLLPNFCSITCQVIVVAYSRLKRENFKLLTLKVVAVAYYSCSFTKRFQVTSASFELYVANGQSFQQRNQEAWEELLERTVRKPRSICTLQNVQLFNSTFEQSLSRLVSTPLSEEEVAACEESAALLQRWIIHVKKVCTALVCWCLEFFLEQYTCGTSAVSSQQSSWAWLPLRSFVDYVDFWLELFSTYLANGKRHSVHYWVLYNNPSYSRILIGSRLWSIRGQIHDWRHHYKIFSSAFYNGGKFWEFR